MNDEVRETLAELCKDKRSDDYVFVSPKDSDERLREVKKGFRLPAPRVIVARKPLVFNGSVLREGYRWDAFTIAQLLGHSDVSRDDTLGESR